jgi:hypothetical protein
MKHPDKLTPAHAPQLHQRGDTMTPTFSPALLASLAQSPEMQALIRAQAERDNRAAHEARNAALVCLRELRQQEAAAQQALDAAVQDLQKAEQALIPKRQAVANLCNAYSQASSTRSHMDREFGEKHGEGVVTGALFRLHQLHKEALQRLAKCEASQNLYYRTEDGRIISSRKNPEMVKPLAESKAEVARLVSALPQLQALVEAPMSPAELAAQVAGILAAAGVKQPVEDATAAEGAAA